MHAAVDPGVNETPHDATERHNQHAVQRYGRVQRPHLKRGMQKDQQWGAYTQAHVNPEPPFHPTPVSGKSEMLAQRIGEQEQQHDAACNTKPVADVVTRTKVAALADSPGEPGQADQCQVHHRVA